MYKGLVIFLFFSFTPCFLVAKDSKHKIVWQQIHYPPLYNDVEGPDRGIHNQVADYLEKETKHKYRFDSVVTNVSRSIELFKNSDSKTTYCFPGGPYAKDMPFVKFTDDTLFQIPATGIAVRKSDTRFMKSKKISLEKLVTKYKTLKVGIVTKGSYHPKVIEISKKHPKSFYKIVHTIAAPPLKMVSKSRIDAFLVFPYSFAHEHITKPTSFINTLKFIEIEETGGSIPAKIYCSDTKKGREIVTEFEKITRTKDFNRFKKKLMRPYKSYNKKLIDSVNSIVFPKSQISSTNFK